MRCNIRSVKSTLRSVRPLNDPYGSNELNKPLTDRYNAGVLDGDQQKHLSLWFSTRKFVFGEQRNILTLFLMRELFR